MMGRHKQCNFKLSVFLDLMTFIFFMAVQLTYSIILVLGRQDNDLIFEYIMITKILLVHVHHCDLYILIIV